MPYSTERRSCQSFARSGYSLKDLAREYTRRSLAQSPTFHQLGIDDQKALYKDVYRQDYWVLAAHRTEATASRGSRPVRGGVEGAQESDRNDRLRAPPERAHRPSRRTEWRHEEVDFPGFVKDLLKGVFDTNLEVTLTQIESYQKLLKPAGQSVAKFINAIDDAASFGYLGENNPDEFGLSFSDDENEDGSRKLQLTDSSREPVDLGENQIKARIMDAKIQMSKEQRALLRETILMGITRLVVEKGNVKASVLFDTSSLKMHSSSVWMPTGRS